MNVQTKITESLTKSSDNAVTVNDGNLDKADDPVGFVNKDVMIDMFIQGGKSYSLVLKGQMTFNGDMGKGKSIKGLFVKMKVLIYGLPWCR